MSLLKNCKKTQPPKIIFNIFQPAVQTPGVAQLKLFNIYGLIINITSALSCKD